MCMYVHVHVLQSHETTDAAAIVHSPARTIQEGTVCHRHSPEKEVGFAQIVISNMQIEREFICTRGARRRPFCSPASNGRRHHLPAGAARRVSGGQVSTGAREQTRAHMSRPRDVRHSPQRTGLVR